MNINKFTFQSDKILASLSSKDQTLFLRLAELISFKKGKMIFYEGGLPTGAFLIKKGRAKIYKTGLYGKDQIFYIYKKGDLFGYHALLCNEKYEDACEALENCEVLFINKYDFEKLLLQIPELKSLLIQNMGHEFGVLVNTITILAQKPVRERLAVYLLILHHRYEESNQMKTLIKLPRKDLMNIIGTSRESLSRLLNEFHNEGLIHLQNKLIEIIDFEKLQRLANML